VSLKKLLATSPQGLAGESEDKTVPSKVVLIPKSAIVSIGSQSDKLLTDLTSPFN